MIPEEQRAILQFLLRAAQEVRYQRWVMFIRTDFAGILRADPQAGAGAGPSLQHTCDPNDVSALSRRGYIEPEVAPTGPGVRVTITSQGERLVANNFVERPAPVPNPQSVVFHGGTFGNVIAGVQGPATISQSPVTQHASGNLRELEKILERLVHGIDASEASEADKNDAKMEVGQIALEAKKAQKNPSLIRALLDGARALPSIASVSAEMAEDIEKARATVSAWLT